MTQIKPPTSFWVISVLVLLWNITGCAMYVMQVSMTPEDILALPAEQQAMLTNVPTWVTSAFALAVWGSLFGSVLLLMRKKLAGPVFVASFAAILIQMYYSFFMSPMMELSGAAGMILPLFIIIVGALLIMFSRSAAAKGWLA
jgi:hypothetical protein